MNEPNGFVVDVAYGPPPFDPRIKADITWCPLCQLGVVIIDGKSTQPLTFWTLNGRAKVTAHAEGCRFRGQALPDEPWTG